MRALQLLVDRGYRVATVYAHSARAGEPSSVAGRSKSLGIPLRDASAVRERATADVMRAEGVDLLLNVHSLHIIEASVLGAPTLGAYNLHPGPLPEWSGLHAPSWALYEGAERYGVTLHRMTPEVDAGLIAFQDDFHVGPTDTALTVMMQCIRRGTRLIADLLDVAERRERIPRVRKTWLVDAGSVPDRRRVAA